MTGYAPFVVATWRQSQLNTYEAQDVKLELIKRFIIKPEMRNKEMIEEYEIHPLTQELLYDEIGDEALHKENIKELVKIIRKMLPSDVQDMVLYLEQNKTLTMNIEKVLEHADRLNIQNDDTFIIKVSLLLRTTQNLESIRFFV